MGGLGLVKAVNMNGRESHHGTKDTMNSKMFLSACTTITAGMPRAPWTAECGTAPLAHLLVPVAPLAVS